MFASRLRRCFNDMVNVLNATELFTFKWLISCDVNSILQKEKGKKHLHGPRGRGATTRITTKRQGDASSFFTAEERRGCRSALIGGCRPEDAAAGHAV